MRKREIGFLLLLLTVAAATFADGPPHEFGPTDPHRITPIGLNQKVLVIYAQANDFRIPAGQLAALNAAEDPKRTAFANWFRDTSWNRLTMQVTPLRTGGSNWYTLPGGLLEYVRPGGVQPMQVRNPGGQTAVNPTPAASVTAVAGGSGSGFLAADAGNYWYAVTSFRNGNESSLAKLGSAVAVTAGQNVTLTINRGAADVDRYLIYRTGVGATNADANFSRVGQVDVAGAVTMYADPGFKPDSLGDWFGLLNAAIQAAHADVNYDEFKGVAVVLFSPFLRGQAAFGTETFGFTGGSINIQGTFVSTATGFGRFTHEMGHWLDLPDLYGIFFNWDTMDCACDGQFYAWEKDHKLSYLAAPSQVTLPIARPAPGDPDFNQPFVLHPTEVEDTFAGRVTAVKIRSSENVHYYVEGRKRIAGQTSDQATPADEQVLVMEAIDVFPATIIPARNVRLLTALSAGAPAFEPDPNVEIRFNSTNPGTPPSFNINVRVKAQAQSDPAIAPWNPPPWESPDVWVDSSREGGGFMTPATATVLPGNGEHAWVNHVNRVWARVHNAGDGPAAGVVVRFQVNTPGGMGDAGQFIDLPPTMPFTLAPHEVKFVFTDWTPTVASHTCIKAEIQHVAGEASIYNNLAQENITDFYTGSMSPWHTVAIPVDVANPYEEPKRVTLRVEGLPAGWKANVDHRWVDLDGKGRKLVSLSVTPKADAPPCTTVTLDVYGVMLIDDYIQRYGGITPVIHLANPIRFRVSTKPLQREGGAFAVNGCTLPPQPNAEVALILQDNAGHDHVVFVQTDPSGCFQTVVNVPGNRAPWTLRPYFKGNECNAPTEGTSVPLDPTGGSGDGGNNGQDGGDDGFHGHRGERELGVFTGGNWPLGRTSRALDPGFLFGIDLLRRWNAQWRFGAQAAWHQFDEDAPGGANAGIANLSVLANFQQPWGPYRTFIAGGPGWYRWDSSSHIGAQLGGGVEVPVSSNAYLMTGITLHAVNGGKPPDPRWLDAYLGFRFRLP